MFRFTTQLILFGLMLLVSQALQVLTLQSHTHLEFKVVFHTHLEYEPSTFTVLEIGQIQSRS